MVQGASYWSKTGVLPSWRTPELIDLEAEMQDLVNTVVLICAAIASLGLGVLLALIACRAGFALLRLQGRHSSTPPLPASTQIAEV